jgi:hypothetical protein
MNIGLSSSRLREKAIGQLAEGMKPERSVKAPPGQLAQHRLSNNVGGVKHFLSALRHALEEERHFALVERCAVSNQSPLSISIQVWNSVRPMHLFDRNLDHDS